MSHTKQTPILEYTDAELQSLTVPAGTITHNTTLSCLSYYTGQEWINSDDWESTYDTVSALSASWSEGASTGAILSASSSANNAALIAKTYSTGYTNIDNEHPGNVRGDYAVDLQMDRHPVSSDAAPQVAAGTGSVIIGGSRNTISVGGDGLYASILGGAGNKIGVAQYGVTIGGASNFVGGDEDNGGTANANYSIACGHNARAIHNDVFIYGSSGTSFESKQINTFNINASNGLRFVHDTNDHTGEVLTCIDADGHGKWQPLSADEWNSAYTTVSSESANWDSTYTTTSANSALWSAGGSTAIVYEPGYNLGVIDNDWPAVVTKHPSGYSDIDTPTPNDRGIGAVDLQVSRQNADQVAGGEHSFILGGKNNKINYLGVNSTLNYYSGIVGGQGNEVRYGEHSIILGGQNNVMDRVAADSNRYSKHSIACGRDCLVYHNNTFSFNDTATTFETKQTNTFNIHANNGMRLVFDSTPQVGQVLTCLDADGHGKWQPLPAAELPDSTGTVYVSKDGDPSYDGLTINQPVSTISDAITIAQSLITAGAYAANIEVLDSGQYIEDITLKDKMTLNAPSAELKGQLTTDNAAKCHVRLGRHVKGAFPATYCVTCGASNAYLYYKADFIDTADQTGILLGTGGYIFADVDEIDIGAGGFGISNAAGGSSDVQVKWLKYTGNTGTAINSTASGSLKVYVSYIGPFGGSNFTNINATAGTCIVDAGQMYITGNAKHWNIGGSADTHIKVNKLTGSTTSSVGTPSSLITGERVDDAYSSYTTVSAESGNWDSTYTTVSAESGNWDSTYTTVQADSATWGVVAGTELNHDNNPNQTLAALEIKERIGTAFTSHNNITQGSLRGAAAVDLQIYRTSADQVAAGPRSALLGGDQNKITTSGNYSVITSGFQNEIDGNYSTILGGRNNIVNTARSIVGGQYSKAAHDDTFVFNTNPDGIGSEFSSVSAKTFNIRVDNGLRLVHDGNDHTGEVLTCIDADGHGKWQTLPAANTQQTITSSASALTLDVSLGHSATTTLTENITSFTIQNASTGDSGVLIISSNGGGWTFPDQNGLGASHIVHTGSPDNVSTLTTATSSAVSIGWYYDGSRHFLYISDPT